MAKRKAKATTAATVHISGHLKRPLEAVLDEALALEGKVAEADQLDLLIRSLEALQATAMSNCPRQSWQRAFTLSASAKKR